jgi:hypothetical protein
MLFWAAPLYSFWFFPLPNNCLGRGDSRAEIWQRIRELAHPYTSPSCSFTYIGHLSCLGRLRLLYCTFSTILPHGAWCKRFFLAHSAGHLSYYYLWYLMICVIDYYKLYIPIPKYNPSTLWVYLPYHILSTSSLVLWEYISSISSIIISCFFSNLNTYSIPF